MVAWPSRAHGCRVLKYDGRKPDDEPAPQGCRLDDLDPRGDCADCWPAVAGDDDDDRVERNGSCSAGTDWKIKAKSDDGRIEVEAEIDSNKVGQTWSWKFKDNGTVFAKGQSTTTGPSGSFEVERKPANLAGTDHFVFRAVHAELG